MGNDFGDDNLNRDDPQAMADALVHGLLSESEAARVRGLAAENAAWRTALDAAHTRHAALLALPLHEPGEALIRRVLDAIPDPEVERAERVRRRHRVLRRVGGVFALAAVVLLAVTLRFIFMSPSQTDVRVTAPAAWLAGTHGAIRIAVFDGVSRRPLAGRVVNVSLRTRGEATRRWGPFETDATGACNAVIDVPEWQDGVYALTVESGGDREERSVKITRSWRLMLTTDKPVYQPGQTIMLRTLTLSRPRGLPVAGRSVEVTLADPRGTVLFRSTEDTSDFGITSAECPLAEEIEEGSYTLRAVVGDTKSERTIQIKRYVLPRFKVEVELDRPFYGPGDIVRGTVNAAYFFGKPVAGTARAEFAGRSVTDRAVQLPAVALDGAGHGTFEFRLPTAMPGDERERGDARIDVSVTVTDTGGQDQGRTLSRVVTTRPLRLSVIPEAVPPVAGVPNRLYVLVTTPDGRPVRAAVEVSGVAGVADTSELGVATIEWTPADQTKLIVTARVGEAVVGETLDLRASAAVGGFLLRTDRGVYDAGDTVHLLAIGPGVEPVYLDVLKDGQLVLTREIELRDGRGELNVDLPPELAGTLEVSAYRYGPAGLPVRQSRVLIVRPPTGLRLSVDADRSEYRPGDDATLTVRLTDADGKPATGAVSLAAVDEAVFSVQDERPGAEGVYFSLDRELLKPAFRLYPWDPFAPGPGEARRELDLAMSAATGVADDDRLARLVDEGWVSEDMLEYVREPGNITRLDDLVRRGSISQQTAAAIRGQSVPAGLVESSSYPQKVAEIRRRRESGLEAAAGAWIVFAVVAVIVGLVLLAIYVHGGLAAGMALVLLLLMAVIVILPAFGKARASARSLRVDSQARALDQAMQSAGATATGTASGEAGPRVRSWFPETLLWRPQIITDGNGRATVPVALADSITTWRLNGSAVSLSGALGAVESSIRVFQPFFVEIGAPVALTRGDEVSVPVTVYNYLENAQEVRLTLEPGSWYTLRGEPHRTISLEPGEVKSVRFRIRALTIGRHALTVSALGAGVGDAIRREIEVVSDGTLHERVVSGTLDRPATADLSMPADVIPGSERLLIKVYPSAFSQLLDGMENIFRMPSGCFEQTSSTTYPNVLALKYMSRMEINAPQAEVKARQYIHLGYQRLVGFEVPGGGFDWFGRPPANVPLTAYGLMEFRDMADVHDVDPQLIARTRKWLLAQRRADGTWVAGGRMHDDPTAGGGDDPILATTAYVAWSVFGDEPVTDESRTTLLYLAGRDPESIRNPHTLALVCNALLAIRPLSAQPFLARLAALAEHSEGGKHVSWRPAPDARTTFYGRGESAAVETTALAALAFVEARTQPVLLRSALAWLAARRDGFGTWGSTQATVLALKAMIGGSGKSAVSEVERAIGIAFDGREAPKVEIPAHEWEVMRLVDLSAHLAGRPRAISLSEESATGCAFQVILRYNTPATDAAPAEPGLSIDLAYDRFELSEGQSVGVAATVRNASGTAAPMLMVDLPVPPGFVPDAAGFDRLVASGTIAKYQVTPRQVIVYLLGLGAGETVRLKYDLRATMPVDAAAPAARVYEYYDPANEAFGEAGRLIVR